MEGGWGLGLVVYLTAPFLKCAVGHCWRAVTLTPESAEEVAVMNVPDFPVLQRDIAPGAAAQVDVVMDFWQADPHGSVEISCHGIW